MATQIADLYVLLRTDSGRFIAEMDAAKLASGGFENAVGTAAKAALGLGVAAAGVAVGVGAISAKVAADFQQSMVLIHTQAGAATENIGQLSSALMAMAPNVGFGPEELAQGLYHVESAGFRGANALDALQASAELARVGGSNLEDTTNALVAVMSAFPQYVGHAGDVIGTLNAIVGTGNMRMQDLASAMSTGILPAAANFGLSITDVGAALATLTDNAVPADEASTRLRMTFALLGAPTGAATKALEAVGLSASDANAALSHREELSKYGIHLTDLASDLRQPNGLLVALTDLKTHLSDAGLSAEEQAAVISRAFGGGRTSSAIETLLTEFDKFKGKYAQLNQGASSFAQAWEETKKTVSFQWEQLQADVQDLGIAVGNLLLPAVSQAATFTADFVVDLQGLTTESSKSDTAAQGAAQAVQRFGRYIATDVIPAAKTFISDVGPPIVATFQFLVQHRDIIITFFEILAARWIAIKAIGMANEIKNVVQAFMLFRDAAGAGAALQAVLGMGGSGGLAGSIRGLGSNLSVMTAAEEQAALKAGTLAKAVGTGEGLAGAAGGAEAAMGGAGLMGTLGTAVPVLGAAVGGFLIFNDVISGLGRNTDALNSEIDQLTTNGAAAIHQWTDKSSQDFGTIRDQLMSLYQVTYTDPRKAGYAPSGFDAAYYAQVAEQQKAQSALENLSPAAQGALVQLGQSGNTGLMHEVFQQLIQDSGNFQQALDDLQAHGTDDAKKFASGARSAMNQYWDEQEQKANEVSAQNAQVWMDGQNQMADSSASAWQSINDAYGAGTDKAKAAIAKLPPAQQGVIGGLQQIMSNGHLTFQQLMDLGSAGVIDSMVTLGNGITIHVQGTLQNVEEEINNTNLLFGIMNKQDFSNLLHNLKSIGDAVSKANAAGAAVPPPVPNNNVKGGNQRAAGGLITEPVVGIGLRTGESWTFGENGPEMVVPNVGTRAWATTGSGGGGDINIGTVNVQGVQDIEAFWQALRNIAIRKGRGSGVSTQYGRFA